MSYDSVGTGW